MAELYKQDIPDEELYAAFEDDDLDDAKIDTDDDQTDDELETIPEDSESH